MAEDGGLAIGGSIDIPLLSLVLLTGLFEFVIARYWSYVKIRLLFDPLT